LNSSFTATVNAELKVGAIEETVTVSGQAPVVDTQNVRQQTTIARDTLDAIPTTKRLGQYATIIPGATYSNPTFQDVGGNQGEGGQFGVHGQRAADQGTNIEGMNQNQQAGGVLSFNSQTFQEVVVETSGASAEAGSGGVQVNIIPKDGGNNLTGSFAAAYAGPSLQNGNLTDELVARGLTTDVSIKRSYDYGGAIGGPIKKDKLWFFGALRWWGASRYLQGTYYNATQHSLFYTPDLDRVSHNNEYFEDKSIRLTWQAAAKHKVVFAFSQQNNCSCPFGLTGVGGVNAVKPAPESRGLHIYNPQYVPIISWSYPATNKLLFEAGASANILNEDSQPQVEVGPNDIRVQDLALNINYGSEATNNIWSGSFVQRFVNKYNYRLATSYITGSHAFKTGFYMTKVNLGREGNYNNLDQIHAGRDYTFRNAVPQSVRIWAVPFELVENTTGTSLFAQDQWTTKQLTLNLGLRYESFVGSVPAHHLPAGYFVPARDFPAVSHSPSWKNLDPRMGVSYDLKGDGKTKDPRLEDVIAEGDPSPLSPPSEQGRAIILTSGTTGTPKGASRSMPKTIDPIASLLSVIPLHAREKTMIAAPLFHAWGFANWALGISLASTVVLRRKFDEEATLSLTAQHECTALVVVPVMIQRILELDDEVLDRYDLSKVRAVPVSGSALPGALSDRWMDHFGEHLYNLYGSTEVAWATIATPRDLREAPGTAGRPPRGTVVKLLAEDGREVRPGETGRIFVGNEMAMDGYTGGGGKQMVEGLMSSGDLGHLDAQGRLFVAGRDDEMIISGGENVFPREVEDLLAGHEAVCEVAVVGVEDDEFGQCLRAFVVRERDREVGADELKDHVKANLARYKVPREIEFLDELPRNATGKILKRDLRARETQQSA